jgi:hypothetical protein
VAFALTGMSTVLVTYLALTRTACRPSEDRLDLDAEQRAAADDIDIDAG